MGGCLLVVCALLQCLQRLPHTDLSHLRWSSHQWYDLPGIGHWIPLRKLHWMVVGEPIVLHLCIGAVGEPTAYLQLNVSDV